MIYKLPRLSRQELEAMFTLSDWKQTRFYQEAFEEGREEGIEEGREEGIEEGREEGIEEGEIAGKLASVPFLLKLGATVEQIAEALHLPLEKVQEVTQQPPPS